MSTISDQLQELLSFLLDEKQTVQCIALQTLLPYTANSQFPPLLTATCPRSLNGSRATWLQIVAHLAVLQSFDIAGQHNAFKILINQSDSAGKAEQILATPNFLDTLLTSLGVSCCRELPE